MNFSKPDWLKVKSTLSPEYYQTCKLIQQFKLNTVCEEAACPNIGECWAKKHVTVMILGAICTRTCKFCNIQKGRPFAVDTFEPQKLATLVSKLNFKHVVITSVTRDDLADGGANHFALCINAIRKESPSTSIEVLTPDFLHKNDALEAVVVAKPDVYNHNIETVPSLYSTIKPGANYLHSLNLLRKVKLLDNNIYTKSGIMLGLGEEKEEVEQVIYDLSMSSVDFLTISQYLQPTPKHASVKCYIHPDEFEYYNYLLKQKDLK